jgi:putative acetyltransferase
MNVRDERAEDHAAIDALLIDAFGGDSEARLVGRLRADGNLPIALVADAGAVVGFVALSTMRSPTGALGLGPVAVAPEFKRRGIGAKLIDEVITRARAAGAGIIFVLGDPVYYSRFGFSVESAKAYTSPYAGPHFMALPLAETGSGPASYAPAFDAL